MHLLKRAVAALIAPEAPAPEESTSSEPEPLELTIEQRLARVEVEIGDLWEHLRRWSARQAARARRDIEAQENGAVQEVALAARPNGAPVGVMPGSKQWRDYQKSLIRGEHS